MERVQSESKTAAELFLNSFAGDYDCEKAWKAVGDLRRRGTDEVFDLAKEYCRSEIPKHRARALDVLAQLGAGRPLTERTHFDECVSIALAHLTDVDPLVVHSAAWALSHLRDNRAVAALLEMRHCPDAGVRWAVACGMHGCSQPEAVRTLVELTDDTDDDVRNWATFALGVPCVVGPGELGALDSIEIREALRKRLNDPISEVRDEALWGLALRKDLAALQSLLARLDSAEYIQGDETAAAEALGLSYEASVDDLRKGLRDLLNASESVSN